MEVIGQQRLRSISPFGKICEKNCIDIRSDPPCLVNSYMDLATKVAKLQFKNPDYVLLFRGQKRDHKRRTLKKKSYTSLAPSLFRRGPDGNPSEAKLRERFEHLKHAEQELIKVYERQVCDDVGRLKRQQILRWSILQHYEVCRTPLLDVTQSLRIAASFASDCEKDEAFVFVLGVPNLSGAITASAEAGIQIVRLSSVCPPIAVRPHIQEGYLLGEYPELTGYDQKQNYLHFEIDFGRRLVAKFRFKPETFWKNSGYFPEVARAALYPNARDQLFKLTKSIKDKLPEQD